MNFWAQTHARTPFTLIQINCAKAPESIYHFKLIYFRQNTQLIAHKTYWHIIWIVFYVFAYTPKMGTSKHIVKISVCVFAVKMEINFPKQIMIIFFLPLLLFLCAGKLLSIFSSSSSSFCGRSHASKSLVCPKHWKFKWKWSEWKDR